MDTTQKSIALLYDTLIYVAKNHNINLVKSVENIYGSNHKERNIKVIRKGEEFSTHTITKETYKEFSHIDISYVLHTSSLDIDMYIEFTQYLSCDLSINNMLIIEAILYGCRRL